MSQASADIARYLAHDPTGVIYDKSAKRYAAQSDFRPLLHVLPTFAVGAENPHDISDLELHSQADCQPALGKVFCFGELPSAILIAGIPSRTIGADSIQPDPESIVAFSSRVIRLSRSVTRVSTGNAAFL